MTCDCVFFNQNPQMYSLQYLANTKHKKKKKHSKVMQTMIMKEYRHHSVCVFDQAHIKCVEAHVNVLIEAQLILPNSN